MTLANRVSATGDRRETHTAAVCAGVRCGSARSGGEGEAAVGKLLGQTVLQQGEQAALALNGVGPRSVERRPLDRGLGGAEDGPEASADLAVGAPVGLHGLPRAALPP